MNNKNVAGRGARRVPLMGAAGIGIALLSGCTQPEPAKVERASLVQNSTEVSRVATNPLSLLDAVKLGVLGSAGVESADYAFAVRENEIEISRSAYYPELFVSLTPTDDAGLFAVGAAGIQYTLYDFGERAALVRASLANAKRARYEIISEIDDAATEVAERYIELAGARRQIEVAERHAKAIASLETRVRSRVEIGAASDSDLKEMEIARLDAASRKSDAANERDNAQAELRSTIGVGPKSVHSIESLRKTLAVSDAPRLNLAEFPKVAARAEELKAAMHTREATRAGLFPKIRAKASVGVDIEDGGRTVGTGLTVGPDVSSTFTLGSGNRKRRENAELEVQIAETQFKEEVRLAKLSAEKARIEFAASQREISNFKSALALSREKYDIQISEYETGARSLRDLVEAEGEIFLKERALVRAYERELVARVELLKALNQAATKLYRPATGR